MLTAVHCTVSLPEQAIHANDPPRTGSIAFVNRVTTDRATIDWLVAGDYENNIYLVTCQATQQSVIVDAADNAQAIVDATAHSSPLSILTTHGHFDHIGAAREVADRLSIPFLLDPRDDDIAGERTDGPIGFDPIQIGELTIAPMSTPGHTPGSTCFLVDGVLLSGDTLFPGGPGATRFDHSSFPTIMDSLRSKLFTLPDETKVLPGHGASTTIGAERPFLDEWQERGW